MEVIRNYINDKWVESKCSTVMPVINPATGLMMYHVPAGCEEDINEAALHAQHAFSLWKNVPATQRIQYLFGMKSILEKHAGEIAEICTKECGKTLVESQAEIIRAIENIEVACGAPKLMQGDFSEDIARGIDEYVIRQPLGVGACIAPFNFPVMIPFWFMPYAIACGNTYIIKPSEKVPMTMTRIFELFSQLNIPAGVLNMVHGGKETADAILENNYVKAISFVGSTDVAKYVYRHGTANGKRVQAQGGAKNSVVVMPDANMETAVKIITDSAFGCAGQRCLAASLVITVGKARETFNTKLIEAAKNKKTGNGLDPNTDMGPVISHQSKLRIENLIQKGTEEGGKVLLDGRITDTKESGGGFFIRPTILDNIKEGSEIQRTEIFGPVLGLMHAENLDVAIKLVNSGKYGNAACIFTQNGSAARKFRNEAIAGNVGVNIGIAAPMAFFPFSGWKDSFFGDLHGQSKHAIEFYTQIKVVIERWHDEWARKF
ncbi:MAG: CoA-acylating methylmalonate-semialdehyde dehydrogenase [Bacteroidales bacterium]|nr:CoA-acylating methylmalonate-semialdehyde dehydrogenase [Bacteroidales bacterium]